MVNSDDFAKRIQKIMDIHQLSAAAFADVIGVQRSSISHILSGRNKPSLDFILKITAEFKDVDMYWLVNGKGTYPKISSNASTEKNIETPTLSYQNQKDSSKKIAKIMVFYTDGTFDEFYKN